MNEYPRSVRDSKLKCIPCNAPVVETTAGGFVCIECGGEPIRRATAKRQMVEQSGIRVERSVKDNGTDGVVLDYELTSNCTVPVGVRIHQPLKTSRPIQVGSNGQPGEWTRTDSGLEYRSFLDPDTTIETRVRVRGDIDESALIGVPVWIDAVDPVDPETTENAAAPVWRGGGAATERHGSTREDGLSPVQVDASPVTARGSATIEPDGGAITSSTESPTAIDEELPGPLETEDRPVTTTGPSSYLLGPESDLEPTISVVLPTMNEEEGIGACIEAIEAALADLEVYGEVIVSDSSTDRTPEIARTHGATVVTPDRMGYGAAYQHGFAHARGDYIVMGDADTTYDFEELPKLFRWVESGDADMVMGSRFAGEIKPGAMPWLHRKIGNPLLTKFLNTFYDADVSDAHSGFRIIRREALEELELRSDGMEFASEMVMAAGERGLTIGEVPITYHPRVGEAKLDSLSDGWRHVKFMLTNTPTHVFSLPAIGLTAIGVVMMALSLLDVRAFGVLFGTHAMIAGSLLTIIGYQVASLAVFSAVAGTAIRSPSDPITGWVKERFALEHGATFGLVLYTIGAIYVAAMAVRWVTSGYSTLPFVNWNMVAFTLIVIGVQTVFYSFFLSLLGQRSEQMRQ